MIRAAILAACAVAPAAALESHRRDAIGDGWFSAGSLVIELGHGPSVQSIEVAGASSPLWLESYDQELIASAEFSPHLGIAWRTTECGVDGWGWAWECGITYDRSNGSVHGARVEDSAEVPVSSDVVFDTIQARIGFSGVARFDIGSERAIPEVLQITFGPLIGAGMARIDLEGSDAVWAPAFSAELRVAADVLIGDHWRCGGYAGYQHLVALPEWDNTGRSDAIASGPTVGAQLGYVW